MATLNTSIPLATLNYSGAGTGPSTTRHAALATDQRISWFKGVDNILDLQITGADRRPVSLLRRELTITMWDSTTGTTIFRRRAIPTVAENGQAQLKVFARDLMTLGPGLYNLGATMVDGEGLETALTWNRAQLGAFDVEVKDAVVPTSRRTHEVTVFTDVGTSQGPEVVSTAYNGPQYYRKDNALFTVGVHATNYTGTIIVQGTMDENVSTETMWADLKPQDYNVATIVYQGYTGIDPYNYYASMRWIRIKKIDNPSNIGSLDKVSIRV